MSTCGLEFRSLFLIERGKSPLTTAKFWEFVVSSTNVAFYPLDLPVLEKTKNLSAIPEMHDRQIIATVLVLQDDDTEAVLITKDERITKSGLVKTIW